MWLRSIKALKLPGWVSDNRALRNALLLCAGLLCADLILYTALVVPSSQWLRSAETKYTELKRSRAEAAQFEKQKRDLAGILAGIPTQKDMPLLVKDLVQSAHRLGLSVSSITYDIPKRSGEDLALLSFSFPVEGKYADLKRFIYEVETSDRLVGIQDMKLDDGKGKISLTMKLVTYIKGKREDVR